MTNHIRKWTAPKNRGEQLFQHRVVAVLGGNSMSVLGRYATTMEEKTNVGCHLISENYAYALQLILGFAALAGLVVSIQERGHSS